MTPSDLGIPAWMEAEHAQLAAIVRGLRRAGHARRPSAQAWHALLAERLGAHMAHEEAAWIPGYAASGPFVANAAPAVLLADHARLRNALAAAAGPGDDRDAAVARCDALWRLAGALEHHDAREARYLVPWLDARGLVAPPHRPAALPADDDARHPARWAADATGDAVADLVTALAGAAPDERIRELAGALSPRTPREAAVIARIDPTDRPAAWDALRLVRAMRAPAGGLVDRRGGA